MYYHETSVFDRTPLINAKNSHFIPQQPLESDIAANENSNMLFWGILAIAGIGGLVLLVNYLDTPKKDV